MNDARTFGENHDAGITSSFELHTGAYERCLGFKKWDSLALHISAHQSAISVVVFKEWDKSGGDRDYLFRGDVHEVDFIAVNFSSFFVPASGDAFVNEAIVLVEGLVSLSDNKGFFFVGGQVAAFVGDKTVRWFIVPNDFTIRGFNEAELIDASVVREGADKPDIGTFWGFNGAHTPVVGVMDVADFKAGAFTGETTGSESRKSTFMS